MSFYDTIKQNSPFFMGDLAKKLASDPSNSDDVKKTYKKIYMHVRVYHREDWICEIKETGSPGRNPLECRLK